MLCATCCKPVRNAPIDFRVVNNVVARICDSCREEWNVGFSYIEITQRHALECTSCAEILSLIMEKLA